MLLKSKIEESQYTLKLKIQIIFQDEGFNFASNGGNGGNGGDPEYRPIDAFIQGILEDQITTKRFQILSQSVFIKITFRQYIR